MTTTTLQKAAPCTEADYEAMKWRGYLRATVRSLVSRDHCLFMRVDCGDVSLSLSISPASFACAVAVGDEIYLHYRDGDNCLVAAPIWISKDGLLPSFGAPS